MTVNLGMDNQGDANNNPDPQQTRSIIRAVHHKDFNFITKVSITSPLNNTPSLQIRS